MKIKRATISHLFIVQVLILLHGCTVAPSERIVEELIVKHFQAQRYKVINIDIGEITSMPMGEKQYMGTPGYDVDLSSITLEMHEDAGKLPYTSGKQRTFNNVILRIKQKTVRDSEWVIVHIEGIAIP